jgi:hypothetical protein
MLKQRIFQSIAALAFSLISFSGYAQYNALDLSIGDSVGFAYNRDMDQRRLGLSAFGIWNFTDDTRLLAPALRYNIIPINDQAFLDNLYVSLVGYYVRMSDDEFDNSTVTAIGFGGGGRIKILDEYSFLRKNLFLNAGFNYAPPGTTYRDGHDLIGWFARLEYPIFDRSLAFLGFRQFLTDLEHDDGYRKENAKIDQTPFIGIQFVF